MLAARILSPHLTRKQTSPGVAERSAQGQKRTRPSSEMIACLLPARRLVCCSLTSVHEQERNARGRQPNRWLGQQQYSRGANRWSVGRIRVRSYQFNRQRYEPF